MKNPIEPAYANDHGFTSTMLKTLISPFLNIINVFFFKQYYKHQNITVFSFIVLKTLISLFLNIINIFFPNNIINITTLLFSLYYVSTNIMSWPLSFQRPSTPASWTTYVVIIKIIKIFFFKISLNITKNIIRNFKHYQNTQTVLLNLSQLAKE